MKNKHIFILVIILTYIGTDNMKTLFVTHSQHLLQNDCHIVQCFSILDPSQIISLFWVAPFDQLL